MASHFCKQQTYNLRFMPFYREMNRNIFEAVFANFMFASHGTSKYFAHKKF